MTKAMTGAALALTMLAGAAVGQSAPDRATTIAGLLLEAELADAQPSRGNRKALARSVAALDRYGVRADAADPGGQQLLAQWRAKAGSQIIPERGRVLGPAFRRGVLDPGGTLNIEQLFLAGQAASVAVAAAPGRGVGLAVIGPDAAKPCAAGERSCRWTPIFTQRYTITVRNGSTARARYYLVMD